MSVLQLAQEWGLTCCENQAPIVATRKFGLPLVALHAQTISDMPNCTSLSMKEHFYSFVWTSEVTMDHRQDM